VQRAAAEICGGLPSTSVGPRDMNRRCACCGFPDGNILAAGLGDGTVRFFRAAPLVKQTTSRRPPAWFNPPCKSERRVPRLSAG